MLDLLSNTTKKNGYEEKSLYPFVTLAPRLGIEPNLLSHRLTVCCHTLRLSRNILVPPERFELPTFGLQNRCTTTVLKGLKNFYKTIYRYTTL